MKNTIGKAKKTFLLASLLALFLSFSMAQDNHQSKEINVSGVGTVYGTPDLVNITIGVTSRNKELPNALDEANKIIASVTKKLKDNYGLENKDMRTTEFSVYPETDYSKYNNNDIVGYSVTNILEITLNDIDKLGSVLTDAVSLGANNIHQIQYDIKDKEPLIQEAREKAVQNAKDKAGQLADLSGVNLSSVIRISESFGGNTMPLPVAAMEMAKNMSVMDVPLSAGQFSVTVQVNVTFGIQ